MSPNNAPQNQDASNSSLSQEATSEPKASCLKEAYKAASKLLRKCWSKRRALPRFIRWKSPNIIEYISGVLAEVRVPIVLGVFFIFLHKPIEEFEVKRLVAPLLAHFDTGWLSSLLALGLALILFLRFIQLRKRRYIVGGKVVLSAGLILTAYLYYRFARSDFEFYGLFDKACPIAFADLIPLACFLTILLRAWTHYTKPTSSLEEKYSKGFLVDHPLTKEEEDICGWRDFAVTLTKHLLATNTERAAFSLGIVASWGEGKSSFMGIMQRYLLREQRNIIVMRFNPWLYDKEAQLTKVFFEELRRTLAPYSSKLSRSIENYADLLLAVDNGWLKFAHQLLRLPQRSTAEQFDKLSRDIQELGKKVVIFIDDVDRLTREELLELFNLVRNSSNLPCLYFVLAYDKSYVLKTLKGNSDEHMNRYPEKILQEEYPLPKLTPDKIWAALKHSLQGIVRYDIAQDIYLIISNIQQLNLPYHLTTIRMVRRMINGLVSSARLIQRNGWFHTQDLFILELIHYVYPVVYEFLVDMYKAAAFPIAHSFKDNPLSIFKIEGSHIKILLPPHSTEQHRQGSMTVHTGLSSLAQLIAWYWGGKREAFEACQLSRATECHIEHLLNLLWGEERPLKGLQINHTGYWDRYFYRDFFETDLAERNFKALANEQDREKRKEQLQEWTRFKGESLKRLLTWYTPETKQEAANIVWALLYWNSLRFTRPRIGHLEIDQLLARTPIQKKQAQELLAGLLEDKDLAIGAMIYIRKWLLEEETESRYFTQDELEAKQISIFKKAMTKGSKTSDLYNLWLLTGEANDHASSKGIRPTRLNELMREVIAQDPGGASLCLLNELPRGWSLNQIPWDTLEEFEEFLLRLNSVHTKSLILFIQKYRETGEKEEIPFLPWSSLPEEVLPSSLVGSTEIASFLFNWGIDPPTDYLEGY